MSSLRMAMSSIYSTPTRKISYHPGYGTPSPIINDSSNTFWNFQFHKNTLEHVFIVPPPSQLLKNPMFACMCFPLWTSQDLCPTQNPEIENEESDLSEVAKLSMRQIENRLAENGIEKENLLKWRHDMLTSEIPKPAYNKRHPLLEESVNLHTRQVKREHVIEVPNVSDSRRLLKVC